VSVERMEADCRIIRELAAGRTAEVEGREVRIKWASGELPIWVAGYGPKALRAAGRVADGVIIQLADPAVIRWCLGFVREGAQEAGRDFVPDEVIDRFCVIGTVEQCRSRIEELVEAGVDQFNLYLMVERPEAIIETYGREIIPHFRSHVESAAPAARS